MLYLDASQNRQNDLCSFPRQTIQHHANPSLCPKHQSWRSWSWSILWRPQDLLELTPQKISYSSMGLECKNRKSRDTWCKRQIWSWSTKWSRAKANRVLPTERTGHSKHPLPTTQEKTLHASKVLVKILQARLQQYVNLGVVWMNEGKWKWLEALLEKGEVSWGRGEAGKGDSEGQWCRDRSTLSIFGSGWSK